MNTGDTAWVLVSAALVLFMTPGLALFYGGMVRSKGMMQSFVCIALWLVLVYVPLAHWVFSPTGWLAQRGVLDFAGGTVVEINSGFSTLALVLVLGKRRGWPREPMPPRSVPLSLLGAGILWFGWFGFNAGSALGADGVAVHAFVAVGFCFGMTFLVAKAVDCTIGLRVPAEDEFEGLDLTQHAETAYSMSGSGHPG